jgi:hypothetical protein
LESFEHGESAIEFVQRHLEVAQASRDHGDSRARRGFHRAVADRHGDLQPLARQLLRLHVRLVQ